MTKGAFYEKGLRFSCKRCSGCCRHDPGFVFLSQIDVDRLARECQMGYTMFVDKYCRWVDGVEGEQLSLREKRNFDCIFWDNGCTVYNARPLQCRTFPFWRQIVSSAESWKIAAGECPGIDSGVLHQGTEIEACLNQRIQEALIVRGAAGGTA